MCRIGIVVWVLLMIALAGLPAGVQAQGADDGLVAEWRFDEGSGSVAEDSSGNGNDGVIHGATWVEGKYGNALSFDGVDDYVVTSNNVQISGASPRTLEFWVYVNEITVHPHIMGWGDQTGINTMFKATIYSLTGGSGTWYLWGRGGGNDWTTGFPVENKKWLHHVLTYDGAKAEWFINGRSIGTFTHIYNTKGTTLEIGIGTIVGNTFNGLIDEVRIYNRALTADEIKSHYEGKQTALFLTKSAAPHSIKQGQTTTVTLSVKNTGTTEITDIEVSDTIPSDMTFSSGETSKTYTSLKPKDSREFQYVLQLNEAGTFNLDPATATYSDEEGNYHTTESKTATITVIQSTDQPATPRTAPKSSTEISTASVHLHGEKTDVVLGEDVLLKLSAVNLIGNPTMRVQVIIIPPSGWSVMSSEFAKSGAGQYTTTYDVEESVGRDIEVMIVPNQIGDDFHVQGRIVYYFGDDSDAREDHTLTLPITVRAEAEQGAERTESSSESKGPSAPGFAAVFAAAGALLVALLIKRRRLR